MSLFLRALVNNGGVPQALTSLQLDLRTEQGGEVQQVMRSFLPLPSFSQHGAL